MPMANKEAQREYQRQWVAKRRQEWIAENGPCQGCEVTDNLEVDHIDPKDKKFHVSQGIWTLAINNPKRIAELAKCQVLCHDCHNEKTIKQMKKAHVHGTRSMYERHKCRCDNCKTWKSIKNAKRYK